MSRRRYIGGLTVEVKAASSKLHQVDIPQSRTAVEEISLKFRVQVKCRHLQVLQNNIPAFVVRRHKVRFLLPFEILHVPVRVLQPHGHDDTALQRHLSWHFHSYEDCFDVDTISHQIKRKWAQIRDKGNSDMFGRVLPLTVTLKLWSALIFSPHTTITTRDHHGMVPTSFVAVNQMLKRVQIEDVKGDPCCVICLEDMLLENEENIILQMPCFHAFHEHCITKWLETSHYCPICRFQMPID